ncbi:hypothetical protein [Lysobacter sp. HA35]
MSLTTLERDFVAGIDVGQVNDWTAIAIVERSRRVPRAGIWPKELPEAQRESKEAGVRLDLVHLERLPLGTKYPQQVDHVKELLRRPQLGDVRSFLDMTGCGRPVFDMFRAAQVPRLSGVMITGARGEATPHDYGWNVGKTELVTKVQVEMQTGRLRFGRRVRDADKLAAELRDFRMTQTAAGNMTFNAREGQHDDLVLALALAVFGALRARAPASIDVRILT